MLKKNSNVRLKKRKEKESSSIHESCTLQTSHCTNILSKFQNNQNNLIDRKHRQQKVIEQRQPSDLKCWGEFQLENVTCPFVVSEMDMDTHNDTNIDGWIWKETLTLTQGTLENE